MIFISTNGIHDSFEGTTKVLSEELRANDQQVFDFRYKPVNAFSSRWRSKGVARGLAEEVIATLEHEEVSLIGHSFGCYVNYRLLRDYDVKVKNVYLIAPAMNVTTRWDKGLMSTRYDAIHVFTNPYDRATLVGGLLFFHPFGWAANIGFPLSNGKIHMHNRPSFVGHNNHSENWFNEKGLDFLLGHILRN